MKGLWVPVSGAIAQQQKIDTLANNIANLNTPGFKRDDTAFKEHLTVLETGVEDIHIPRKDWSAKDFYHLHGQHQAKVEVSGSFTDFGQGQIVPTGNPLDLAINGKGFFEVLTPQGIQYAREGSLTVDKDGVLVSRDGLPFLKEGEGDPEQRKIQIPPNTTSININREGTIATNDGSTLGKISVREFNQLEFVRKSGNGRFTTPIENLSTTTNSSIVQGSLEQSNVNPIMEMSELIKAQRQFESLQRAIKTYDSISARSVNDIGKF